LKEPEQEEPAWLRREKAEQHAREKATWEKNVPDWRRA
jgi:hypothetical protein